MNWKLTRPGHLVTFEGDEPICQITPQRRGELEAFYPRIEPLTAEPELAADHRHWAQSRRQFVIQQRMTPRGAKPSAWQRHYFRGTSPSSASAREHQSRLKLRAFQPPPSAAGAFLDDKQPER